MSPASVARRASSIDTFVRKCVAHVPPRLPLSLRGLLAALLLWVVGCGGMSDLSRWAACQLREAQNAMAQGLRAGRAGRSGRANLWQTGYRSGGGVHVDQCREGRGDW